MLLISILAIFLCSAFDSKYVLKSSTSGSSGIGMLGGLKAKGFLFYINGDHGSKGDSCLFSVVFVHQHCYHCGVNEVLRFSIQLS